MKLKTYFAFTIQVFKEITKEGKLVDYSEVEIIADTEAEALEKAQLVLVRPNYAYRVSRVSNYQLVEHDKK